MWVNEAKNGWLPQFIAGNIGKYFIIETEWIYYLKKANFCRYIQLFKIAESTEDFAFNYCLKMKIQH